MRDIEEPSRVAYGVMFREIRAVAHGHLPATEIGERGTQRLMTVAEWGG